MATEYQWAHLVREAEERARLAEERAEEAERLAESYRRGMEQTELLNGLPIPEWAAARLREVDAAREENERLRTALQEISEKLPCESPCFPKPETRCDTCGVTQFERWCAGCTARRALSPTSRKEEGDGTTD